MSPHVSSQAPWKSAEGVSVTEWVPLRTLYDKPGTSHADLIQALGMTKGATSKVVTRLEEQGLVKREMAEGSNREQMIVLTLKGIECGAAPCRTGRRKRCPLLRALG